jgi:hypothetical protein
MTELSVLALQCERAAYSSFALNCSIGRLDFYREEHGDMGDDEIPDFSGSIDAAMTLRPAGWSYQLKTAEHHENGFQFECWVSWGPDAYKRISSQAPTEARAISAGWLRARIPV